MPQLADELLTLAAIYMPKHKLDEFAPRASKIIAKQNSIKTMRESKLLKKASATRQLLDELADAKSRKDALYALHQQALSENKKLRAENRQLQKQIMQLEIKKGIIEVNLFDDTY